MASFADDFKAEARRSDVPVRKVIRGWAFILSHGAVKPDAELMACLSDEQVASVLKRVGASTGDSSISDVRKHAVDAAEDPAPTAKFMWVFSACLNPRGRSSTGADWKFLGEMTAALDIPDGALATPFETTDPNGVHYWIWYEFPFMSDG